MRGFLTALLLSVLLLPAQAVSRKTATAPELGARAAAVLARHVDGEAISAWLAALPAGSLERDAAEWILAWLPEPDLVAIDLELLREHVDYSARVYREAPWRAQMSRYLWLHFVVPHRVSQEPAQAWRARFYREIWPRVADATSMEQAALEVNRWCREQATFRSTSGRDMGPLTTIARGLGRCEEEMILSISALRAVGLPARSCATPYWTFTDNNHAWVEVWADGRWFYLGACEPGQCLNDAWFTGAARRAGFVRSVAYGELDPGGEPLYRSENGSTLVNSTAVYTDPFRLRADLAPDARTAAETQIHVNVLNFGNLRAIASIAPGDEIELGPGEYALTAAAGGELLLKVVGGAPGETVSATLGMDDAYDLELSPPFWLRYPEAYSAPRRDLALVSADVRALSELRVQAKETDRAKLRVQTEAERALLAALPAAESERFLAAIDKPCERVSTLFLLLAHYSQARERDALLALLERADDKDLLELGEAEIRSHIDGALAVRERLAPVGLSVPDSLFFEDVLACRIDLEPGSAWRGGLPLIPLADGASGSLSALLTAFRERMELRERGFFGPPLDPAQCWRLGGGDERDLGIALVGLLRRNGFPARRRHDRVAAWLGEWLRLDPVRGEIWSGEAGDGGGTGRLRIEITRGGLPYPEAESYKHFNLGRIEAGKIVNPWWDPAVGEQEWEAGDYVLCTVLRVPGGSACGRLRSFTVQSGGATSVNLPASAAGDGWDAATALFSGPEPAALIAALPSALPQDALLFAFAPGEPAERMLDALSGLRARLDRLGIAFIPLLVGDGDADAWSGRVAAAGWPARIELDPGGALLTLGEGGTMEPILLLIAKGEARLLRQGFDASADASVHLALDLLE